MSKKITLENVDSSELPEIPVIGEVKQIRFTQDMELVSTLADSDLFMVQVGADLEARPNTITFDLIIKNLSGPIEEGSKKFVTGDMMFKVIGDMNLLDTWDNTNIVSSLNATYVNVRRIEEELRREINRSTGKDELHDSQIANLRQDLTSTNELLNQEINRSVAKDKEHDELLAGLRDDVDSTSEKLDAEIDRSTAKDAEHDTLLKGLRVDVNANKSAIESEVARSTARDEAHDAAIAKNASDITTEVNRAKAEEAKIRQEMKTADTNLQNAITAETERATGVEEDLQQQITDLSGSTDDRLEALEALSHEQNTDTGTTSKTFVIDSGNTGAMLKAEGGGLSTRTKGDAGYANFTVQNLVIKGDVTQEGDTFITQAERVEVRDNMILINEGETGAGVTAGFAGIEVDRGTEQNFMFGFNESDGMFKIGKEGNMFDVALRQPVGEMTDGMFASWDAATKTFKTTNLIPPTLQLYFGVPEVSVKYASDNNGSLQFVTNDKSWSVYTGVGSTKFTSSENRFRFYGEVNISDGVLKCDVNSFQIQVASANKLVISGSGSTLSTPLTANSFFRSSDNAEVLYATDITTLTDGMFLSWDADNKKVVTTNKLPIGKKLYIAYDHTYITEGGSDGIEFNTRDAWLRVSTGSVESRFVSSANWFLFEGNISTTGKIATTGTNLRLENKSNYLSIGNGASTMDTTLKATTFYRSSDNSEVLYQADLKSVLTGKETNYAPTVKAVSDAIDAVNTGTTESLKGYLKLSGGTMTGSIRIVDSGSSSTLQGIYNNDGTRALLFTYLKGSESRWGVGTKETVGIIRSNVSDLIHLVNNNGTLNEYSIYDKRNLPDPATKSGNNAFTGTNSFVGGKFSVAGSESEVYVSAVGNLVTRSTYGTTGWIRSLEFSDNDVVVARFGVKAVTTNNVPTTNFVGILVGNGTVNDSQYKFSLNKMEVPSVFILSTANGVSKILSASSGRMKFGDYQCECYLESKDVDLIHNKNNVAYKIWDASNLPTPASTSDIPDVSDMAKRSEANTFTANNTFTAGQFNVGALEVSSLSSIVVNLSGGGEWARTLSFLMESDTSSQICFGAYSNTTNTNNYAYIGIGDVNNSTAQYRFYSNKVLVPETWTLADFNGRGILVIQDTTTSTFGRIDGTTYIRGGDTDLYHIKGSTNYKILDESNYSQYLPTTSKWTYGFVTINPRGNNVDFNTVLSGPDSPKILLNYDHELGNDTNAPTDMKYGAVLQIDGNYNSSYNNNALRPQLAFDVNHNAEASTRYMWFRTANNLGYGDSSNWKRVVTADENVVAFITANGYPTVGRLDGSDIGWLRTPASGLLPTSPTPLANGGNSSLGNSSWSFSSASIANVYANNYYFGNTGIHLEGNDDEIGLLNAGTAKKLKVGSLLVSSNYSDTTKVPTNGIFASGAIKSYSGFTSDFRLSDINITKTGNDVWHLSSFANSPENMPGIDPVSGQVINDGALLTYFWETDYAFQLAGDIDGTGMAYRSYTPSTGATKAWKFLADTAWVNTKLGSYLPLTGGTVSGSLSISPVGSDTTKVPTNGIFASGRIQSNDSMLVGYSENVTEGMLGYGLYYDGTFAQGLGSEYSSGALVLYKMLNPNKGKAGYNVPRAATGTPTYLKITDGTVKLGVGVNKTYTAGEAVTVTEHTLATLDAVNTKLGSYLPLTGGTVSGSLSISPVGSAGFAVNNADTSGVDVIQTFRVKGANKFLFGWSKPGGGAFIQRSDNNRCMVLMSDGLYTGSSLGNTVRVATLTDLGGYLPLTGGSMTGRLVIAPHLSHCMTINNITSGGKESYLQIQMQGTSKAAIGFLSGSGSYIHNYEYSKYLFVKSDGAYFGTPDSSAKLLTSADLSSYATQSWVTNQAYHKNDVANARFTQGIHLHVSSTTGGWARAIFISQNYSNGATGVTFGGLGEAATPTYAYIGVGANIGYDSTSNFRVYTSKVTFAGKTLATVDQIPSLSGYATQSWVTSQGYLTSVPSTYATQSWVTSQGYLTSITKSMVTTALGYTPPTTNTTYSQATSSTLGLVKIGATGLASKNYAVKLNSSGQMYVAVPWTDTDTNTHYTTRLYAGESGTAANSATTSPYIKVTDDNTCRNQIRLLGGGATSVSSDAFGNITITSTNTTYGLATASSNGLMSSSQYTKLRNCIETISATNMVTSVQVVDTIPATSSQVTGRLYLKFA